MPTRVSPSSWRIHGRSPLNNGAAAQLSLRAYATSLASARRRLGDAQTDDDGNFALEYPAPHEPIILELFGVDIAPKKAHPPPFSTPATHQSHLASSSAFSVS